MPEIWALTASHESYEIPRGTSARLRIATVDEERRYFTDPEDGSTIDPDYGWNLLYEQLAGHRGWHGGRRGLDEPDREWFTVRVAVRSQPELEDVFATKRIRLLG